MLVGFVAGVMIAVSFYSLLLPAEHMANSMGQITFIVVAIGFLLGGTFLKGINELLHRLSYCKQLSQSSK